MSDPFLVKYIAVLKDHQSGIAEAAMLRPKPEPFEYGVQAGRHQGLQLALDILEDILRDNLDKETNA